MAPRKDSEEKPKKPFRRSSTVEEMRKALGECAEGVDDDTLLLLRGYAQAVIAQVLREIKEKTKRKDSRSGGKEIGEGQ